MANHVTPAGRCEWPNVFEARASQDGQSKPKFGIDVLLKKGDPDVEEFIKALKVDASALVTEEWPNADKRPKKLNGPIKDGDTWTVEKGQNAGSLKKDLDPNVAGHYVLRCSRPEAKGRPGVVDANCKEIIDPCAIQGGYWVKVDVRPYVYNRPDACGWSLNLDNVQLVKKDKPFAGGSRSAADAFGGGKAAAAPSAVDDLI